MVIGVDVVETNRIRVLIRNIVVGSFDLPMPKIPSASAKNDDSVSMIVNIDKKSKQSSKKTNDVRPRDGDIGAVNTTSAKDREVKATSALNEEVNMATAK